MTASEVKRGRRGRLRSRRITNGDSGQDWMKPFEDTSYWTDLPEFFHVYMPDLCSNALRIPSDFLKKFGEKIPTSVTLRVLSGLSWPVHIHQVCDKWFFQKGWKEFVVENSIEDGDFMTFCYVGNSVFSVSVFGRNGCRKRDADVIDVSSDKSVGDTEESESVFAEIDDHTSNPVKRGSPECSTRSKTVCRNPAFSVVLRQCHLRKFYVNVPMSFSRSHLTQVKKERVREGIEVAPTTLWYKKKLWEVSLRMTDMRCQITKDWHRFARDNSVKTGDICIFELIDGVDLSFKVFISR